MPTSETFDFTGPVGRIEAILMGPELPPVAAAVVCHAHPLHGGMMHFKVVFRIAKTLQDVDLSKIVFLQYPTGYTDDKSGVVPSDSAQVVNAALQADLPVAIDPAATAESEFGTVADPNAAAPAPPAAEVPATGEAPATGDPAAPAAPAPEVLPEDVTGQNAAEVRCASANAG